MTHNRILCLVFFVVLGTAVIASAADVPVLVFSDGSTMKVASLSMERGFVVVETADGRKQQFDRRDIDLQASGLVQEVPQAAAPVQKQRMAPKLVMPGDIVDSGVLTISDHDVGHVRTR